MPLTREEEEIWEYYEGEDLDWKRELKYHLCHISKEYRLNSLKYILTASIYSFKNGNSSKLKRDPYTFLILH